MPKKATRYTDTNPDRYRSKEERVDYAFKVLNRYDNVFISENIRKLWDEDDLAAYLSARIKHRVTIRNCHYMDDGCVAEVDRKVEYKSEE